MTFEDTFIGRPNTVTTYKSLFKNHISKVQPETDWEGWQDLETIKYLHIWEEEQLSRRTRQSLLRLLGRYIEFMGGPKIKTRTFARTLERGEQQREPSVLSKQEARALMATCKRLRPEFYPILLLALHAGLRRGEIFGLTCGDIDMFKGKVRVAHNYKGPTKNGKTRYVPMSEELIREMVKARNLLLRSSTDTVFEQMDPNPILKFLCSSTKVPSIRFHDLRHTFATMALENGVSPRHVAAWLGHSSVTTTLSIYWGLNKHEFDINEFLPGGTE
jgi:integrase